MNMDVRGYANELEPILATRTAEALRRLARFRLAAEEAGDGIEGIAIDVFVDQDGEGPFDVWARFEGSGAFALDRRFDEERHLFGVEWGEEGWEPGVPARPGGWTRGELEPARRERVAAKLSPLIPLRSPEGFWRIRTPNGMDA
jgi:hypothetical protein